jgi:hypothetical protein
MGVWKTISNALFKEYDRRIKRASLITEYGAAHHSSHDDTHADLAHDHAHEDVEEAEIANIPRGTPVAATADLTQQPPAEH